MTDPILTELRIALIKLLLDQPLIGQIILHLQLKEVSWCSTAATDGRYLYYNKDFIASLTRSQLLFLLAHEVLHVAYDHIFRRGRRNKDLWNMAVDFLVNDTLIKAGIGTMPPGGLHDQAYTDDFSSEELYALLEQKVTIIQIPLDMHLDATESTEGDGKQSGATIDVTLGENGPPQLSEEEIQEIRDTIRATLLQAAQQVDPGKIPAGIQRLLNRLAAPQIDWRHMLDNVLRSAIKHDYTYTRMSRRSWGNDLVLPGQDVMDRVVAVAFLDGSGSTTQEMITDFLSECKGIMQTFRDFELTIGTFDTEVYNVVVYTPDNADEIDNYDFTGGGGTMPSCCWEYMKSHDIMPHKLLIFTDGHVGNDWGDKDYCDALFIIHSNTSAKAPYGVSVTYEPRH